MKRSLQALLCIVFVVALGSGAAEAQTTALYVDSEPGELIRNGQDGLWTPPTATFSVQSSNPSAITMLVQSPELSWTVRFTMPAGQVFSPGVYDDARSALVPVGLGLAVATFGSCSYLSGRFRVYEVAFDEAGTLTRFAVDFEQHCFDQTPGLFGALRYNATRTSLEPFEGAYPLYALRITPVAHGYVTGPGINCGEQRTDCEEVFPSPTGSAYQAIPSTGYLFLGWAGPDCGGNELIGFYIDRLKTCTPIFASTSGRREIEPTVLPDGVMVLDGSFHVGAVRQRRVLLSNLSWFRVNRRSIRYYEFYVDVQNITWSVTFAAPVGEELQPGTYEYTTDKEDFGPRPFLSIGAGTCVSGGRFRLYEVEVGSTGKPERFAADFEAVCNGELLRGVLRYRAERTSLRPFDGEQPAVFSLRVIPSSGGYVTSPGIDCGEGRFDCNETFARSAVLRLTATPLAGYDFLGWGGDGCAGRSNPIDVPVDRMKRCFAVFDPSVGSAAVPDPRHAEGTLFLDAVGATAADFSPIWLSDDWVIDVTNLSGVVQGTFGAPLVTPFVWVGFGLPSGRLTPGVYDEAYQTAWSKHVPYLDFSHCVERAARFQVYEATYDSQNRILTLAVDFEVHCQSTTVPFVAGAIRYRSTRPNLRPFDGAYPLYKLTVAPAANGRVTAAGIDCGPSQGDCSETYPTARTVALQATPSAGYRFAGWTGACDGGPSIMLDVPWVKSCAAVFNAVPFTTVPVDPRLASNSFLIDSRDDPLGKGRHHLWLDATIRASATEKRIAWLSIEQPEGPVWLLVFRAPGTSQLAPGVYESTTGGLSITSPLGACQSSPSVGRFVVHEVGFGSQPGTLLSFAADFEYRCSPNAPALFGSIRFMSTRSTVQPFDPAKPPADITGDLWPDVVFQNRADGRLLAWGMNRGMKVGDGTISPSLVADPMWHVVGTGDANRDGHMDLYWHHQTTGDLAIWLMNGPTQVAAAWIMPTPVADTQWKVKTVADMDRDGYPDLIWHHSAGALAVWYLTGTTHRSDSTVPHPMSDPNWNLAAAADVNGDDYPDLLWHHTATGELRVWYMQGHTRIGEAAFAPDRLSDTSWRLRGAVDLDRNGYPDLIWQNTTTFEIGAWLLERVTVIGGQWLGPPLPSADWHLVSPK
jgi:hypothetical protein